MSSTPDESYPLTERRSGLTEEKVLLMIANALTAHTSAMEQRIIDAIDHKFDSRFSELDERISAIQDVFTDHVAEAFPDGPLVGHKLDHEGRIKWAETKHKLGVDLLRYAMLGAVGFVFLLIGLGMMEYIEQGITK
jgi:hypothetical protein